MQRTPIWLVLLTLFLIAFSVYALYPTFRLWMVPADQRADMEQNDPAALVSLEKRAIKLGLDLRGGMHVVLEVDKSKLNENEKNDAVDRALEVIRNRIDEFGVAEPLIQKSGDDRIIVELPGIADPARARELIGRTAQLEFKLMPEANEQETILRAIDRAVAQALPDEMNAIAKGEEGSKPADLFSDTSKPDLFDETPDTTAKAKAKTDSAAAAADTSLAGDSLLAARPFSLLLQSQGYGWTVQESDVPTVKRYLDLPEVKAAIPPGIQLAWGTRSELAGGVTIELLYILKSRVELSGQYLTDARPQVNQESGGFQVSFELTREGGSRFHRITRANIGKPLVIVLDNRVESAATIQSAIRDRGRITLGSGATYDEAKDLSIVLRAGALPAPVLIAENNVVGPSLGRDSVTKGTYSAMVGFLLVVLFMAIYYQISGLVADIALLFNLIFLMAFMAMLHATLTMPGIAGIILTMGMSVDSNVLIFERIREELRTGKTVRAAIDAGYSRALLTIIDAHVTTLITAAVLFIFGTGPIKGFAVTLSLGVSISLFTALFITKAIFDARKQYKSLSI
jgi:protein-export membrane protein SecD